jgi:CheY-like chemotaxis protein
MTHDADPTRLQHLVAALRRYARAAVGEAGRADACVAAALERYLEAPVPGDARLALYRAVYAELRRTAPAADEAPAPRTGTGQHLAARVRRLEPEARHALLLRRLEGFDTATVAAVMALDGAAVERRVRDGLRALREPAHAAVLILEDDARLARELSRVVVGLGHDVTAVARTAEEAVAAARERRPDVVLAELELGGGRDGLAAIEAIRADDSMPAIFVTGTPERVSGRVLRRPDCLLRKPVADHVLATAVDRALGTAAGRTL